MSKSKVANSGPEKAQCYRPTRKMGALDQTGHIKSMKVFLPANSRRLSTTISFTGGHVSRRGGSFTGGRCCIFWEELGGTGEGNRLQKIPEVGVMESGEGKSQAAVGIEEKP